MNKLYSLYSKALKLLVICTYATHKFKGTVIGEELLHSHAPVRPEFQHTILFRGQTDVAAPGIDLLQLVKSVWSNQHVQAVLTETPGGRERRERE